ncbi:MAG: CIA30 family protein [Lewinellaceae bacterium]|nr:CIA30 family protein [Lewinellaceae bacterium]
MQNPVSLTIRRDSPAVSVLAILFFLFLVSGLGAQNDATKINVTASNGIAVNTWNGNLFYSVPLFTIPGPGLPVRFQLNYNSSWQGFETPYGYGWNANYHIFYTREINGDILVSRGNGRADRFAFNIADGSYTPPKAVYDALEEYQPGKFRLQTKAGVSYYFDSAIGKMVSRIVGPNGNTVHFDYDADGLLIAITGTSGLETSLEYQDGKLSKITGPAGRAFEFSFGNEGNLLSITNPMGHTVQYGYDGHYLTAATGPLGNTGSIAYSDGRVNSVSNSIVSWDFAFDEEASACTVDYGGQATTYTYDEEGRISTVTGPLGYEVRRVWDEKDNLTGITDENGNTATYAYDARGNVTEATDALGFRVTYEYEPDFNKITSYTNANNHTTTYGYDDNGNLTAVGYPLGISVAYSYDDFGNIISYTDGNGNQTSYTYDEHGNLSRANYPIGSEEYEYDLLGNVLSATDAVGNTTTFTYDLLNRLASIRDPLGNTIQYTYDANGNRTSVTDPKGNVATFVFDALNRLTAAHTPAGTIGYAYDAHGNLTALTNLNGYATQFLYNNRNQLIQEINPLGHSTYYAYDPAGNLVQHIDANGNPTTYEYDALNRLVAKSFAGNSESFTYDPLGNKMASSNDDILIAYSYDALSRLTSKTVVDWNKTIEYEYDDNGNRTKMVDPSGGETQYTYDGNNRLTALQNPSGLQAAFTYDAAGRATRQDNANGTYTTYSYDAASRLLEVANHSPSGDFISSFDYSYDANGNRLSMAENNGGLSAYTYDSIDQLTGVTYATGTTENYVFDAQGNRQQVVRNGTPEIYAHNPADQLLARGDVNYEYDRNGNMSKKIENGQETTYEYDGENRLIKITFPNGLTNRFKYTPSGRRIEAADTGNNIKRFFYDQDNTLYEYDEQGNNLSRFTSGLSLDSWLMMETGGNHYTYHKDGLGSTMELTGAGGAIQNRYRFDVYGNVMEQNVGVGNPYLYTGRRLDVESGFYYYRARYYDPIIGRFSRYDPLGYAVGINTYIYTKNNPVNLGDPTGLISAQSFFNALNIIGSGIALAGAFAPPIAPATTAIGAAITLPGVIYNTTQAFQNPNSNTISNAASSLGSFATGLAPGPLGTASSAQSFAISSLNALGVPIPANISAGVTGVAANILTNALANTNGNANTNPQTSQINNQNGQVAGGILTAGNANISYNLVQSGVNQSQPFYSPTPPPCGCQEVGDSGDGGVESGKIGIPASTFLVTEKEEEKPGSNPAFPPPISLATILPTQGPAGTSLIATIPQDVQIGIANVTERLGHDFRDPVTDENRASILGITTAEVPYNHEYAVCNRFHDYVLHAALPIPLEGLAPGMTEPAWFWYATTTKDSLVEETIVFNVFVDESEQTFTIDSRWLSDLYPPSSAGFEYDYVFNFQVWASNAADAILLVKGAIENLENLGGWETEFHNTAEPAPPTILAKAVQVVGGTVRMSVQSWAAQPEAVIFHGTYRSAADWAADIDFEFEKAIEPGFNIVELPLGDLIDAAIRYSFNGFSDKLYVGGGFWFVADDGGGLSSAELELPNCSSPANITDSDLQVPGCARLAGAVEKGGFVVLGRTLNPNGLPVDIGQYAALSFFARGDGKSYRVLLENKDVIDGGGGDFHQAVFTTTNDWKQYVIPYTQFRQQQSDTLPFTGEGVKSIVFSSIWGPHDSISLSVERVAFINSTIIEGVTQLPHTSDVSGPYAVHARIADDAGVASATLHYSTDNGVTFQQVPMNGSVGGFEAAIPGQPLDTEILYYIQAEDAAGNRATNPVDVPYTTHRFQVSETPFYLLDAFNDTDPDNHPGQDNLLFESPGSSIISIYDKESVELAFDVSTAGSYAGYLSETGGINLEPYTALTFRIKGDAGSEKAKVSIKDSAGYENKIIIGEYLAEGVSTDFQRVFIPLAAFGNPTDFAHIEQFVITFEDAIESGSGAIYIDDIKFETLTYIPLVVDNFNDQQGLNGLGGTIWKFTGGGATLNTAYDPANPYGPYGASYKIDANLSNPGDWAVAAWNAPGNDINGASTLSFKIKGAVGGEKPNIYLVSGLGANEVKRMVGLENYGTVETSWTAINIPLEDFPGINLANITQVQFAFEWALGQSTIWVDDLVFASPLALLVTSIENVQCFGGSDGTATVSVQGGTPPFNFLWTNGGTSSTAEGLSAGTYAVTVTDATGTSAAKSVTISEPEPLSNLLTGQHDASCFGASDGGASFEATGGIPPYAWSWPGGGTASQVDNLPAGNYEVTLTDANDCVDHIALNISEPAPLVLSINSQTNVDCYGNSNGAASIAATGGTFPYAYSWPQGIEGPVQDNLSAGIYPVTVADANGCTAIQEVAITEPSRLEAVAASTDETAFGANDGTATASATGGTPPYQYAWSNNTNASTLAGLTPGAYTVTITDSNGCEAQASVTISGFDCALSLDLAPTPISCHGGSDGAILASPIGGAPPYQYEWTSGHSGPLATGLAPGTYTVTVSDGNNCAFTSTITLPEPPALAFTTIDITAVSCHGGSDGAITIDVAGGTPPYTFEWESGTTGSTLLSLQSGTYGVTLTDGNNCTLTGGYEVGQPQPLAIQADTILSTSAGGNTGAIEITVTGGVPPYQYQWYYEGVPFSTNEDPQGLAAGAYTIEVTDTNGCIALQEEITVEILVATGATIQEKTIKIIPNPTTGLVHIRAKAGHAKAIKLSVFNVLGQEVFSPEYEGQAGPVLKLDLSPFPDGVYYINISVDGQMRSGKVVLSK